MSLQCERMEALLQRLGLTDMAQSYAALAEQAAQKNLSYCGFLEQVLESEAHARQGSSPLATSPGSKWFWKCAWKLITD